MYSIVAIKMIIKDKKKIKISAFLQTLDITWNNEKYQIFFDNIYKKSCKNKIIRR